MVEVRIAVASGQGGHRASRLDPPEPPNRFARMRTSGGRLILLNPADDAEFVAWTRRLAAGPAVDPARLQDLLRVRYPAAVVRRRDLSYEQAEVWYVYRDGRWVPHPSASSPAAG